MSRKIKPSTRSELVRLRREKKLRSTWSAPVKMPHVPCRRSPRVIEREVVKSRRKPAAKARAAASRLHCCPFRRIEHARNQHPPPGVGLAFALFHPGCTAGCGTYFAFNLPPSA